MAGHSKWANIKRKKQSLDLKKGKEFSKISRMITVAVIEGRGVADPEYNVRLRMAIERAKEANMPKDKITRAIEKGKTTYKSGLIEVIYEAILDDVVFLIQATTENPQRTRSVIKEILESYGGKLLNEGTVAYLFKKCGLITLSKNLCDQNQLFLFATNIQAFDIDEDKENYYLYIPFETIGHVGERIPIELKEKIQIGIDFKPKVLIKISDPDKAKSLIKLVEQLEGEEDIQSVYTNFEIPDKFLEEIND